MCETCHLRSHSVVDGSALLCTCLLIYSSLHPGCVFCPPTPPPHPPIHSNTPPHPSPLHYHPTTTHIPIHPIPIPCLLPPSFWNYASPPTRGAREVAVTLDGDLIYQGILRPSPDTPGQPPYAQSVLFSNDPGIVGTYGQEACCMLDSPLLAVDTGEGGVGLGGMGVCILSEYYVVDGSGGVVWVGLHGWVCMGVHARDGSVIL